MALYLGGICFITGAHPALDVSGQIARVLQAGLRWVQLRDKNPNKHSSRRAVYLEALEARKLTAALGASLIINDYPDIALAAGADGVHLGQDDIPLEEARKLMGGKIIGISTHSVEEAVAAWKGGADYIGFGPVYETGTKDAGPPKGLELLGEVKRAVGIPVVAIGGITAGAVPDVIRAGADAIAVSGAILDGDVFENAKKFIEAINSLRR